MESLKERMKRDLEIRGLSPNTQRAYLGNVQNFVTYIKKSPVEVNEEEIKDYLYYLITTRKLSKSYVNNVYSALRFFYETTLKKGWDIKKIPRTKKIKRLPIVLSKEEIKAIFDVTTNFKHKTMLITTYAAGLRVSETANLKLTDVDSKNMQLRIEQGKGRKDRYSLLSKNNIDILRDYWKAYRPHTWLFPGRTYSKPITTRSIQKVFSNAKEKVGIKKPATVHSLRHSFATHLLESGASIYHIQKLMGHSSVKTTSIYIHVQKSDVLKITSPLDSLMESEK